MFPYAFFLVRNVHWKMFNSMKIACSSKISDLFCAGQLNCLQNVLFKSLQFVCGEVVQLNYQPKIASYSSNNGNEFNRCDSIFFK